MSNPNIVSSGFSAPLAVKFVARPTTAVGSFWTIESVSPAAWACVAENPIAAGTSSPSARSRRSAVGRRRSCACHAAHVAARALNERSTPSSTLARLPGNVEFLILGPLEARIDGRTVALGAPRQRLLLAALLLAAPAPLRREQLIDEIWGAAPPASARARGRGLRQPPARRARRRRRSPAARARPTRSPATVDARRFEELASGEPGEAQLAEALALWRGPVLADLAYEGSLRTEIARLRGAAARGARASSPSGGCSAAATRRRWPICRQLVAARAAARARARPADARALPRRPPGRGARRLPRGRELLVEELGLEPGAPLRELQAAILRQDPALVGPRRAPAPQPARAADAAGRARAGDRGARRAAARRARLVTLDRPRRDGQDPAGARRGRGAAGRLRRRRALRRPVGAARPGHGGARHRPRRRPRRRGRARAAAARPPPAARARQLRAGPRRGAAPSARCSRARPACGSWRRAARAWTSTASTSSRSTRSSTTRASSCSAPAPARATGASSATRRGGRRGGARRAASAGDRARRLARRPR